MKNIQTHQAANKQCRIMNIKVKLDFVIYLAQNLVSIIEILFLN